ncbi:hypothetical protein [Novosphingopyxis sp.]|uniref:hypothetical protein n=1 Tax=Novosphingopyxis sp. TaxID=2709690 RepID=UPI003B5A7C86
MTRFIAISTLAISLSLAACAKQENTPDDQGDARTDLEAATDDFIVNAGDFDREQLGARIVGPVGPEVEGSLVMADGTSIGDIKSYVACPENIDTCDPAKLPADTIYTFVHMVTPGVDEPNDDPIAQPETVKPVAKSVTFRMTMPAGSFAGQAGYSLEQARAALGPQGTFTVKCNEGMLVWEVATGETWGTGEPVTFFWKSRKPPKGPADAYGFEADGYTAKGKGPFPAPTANGDATGCT